MALARCAGVCGRRQMPTVCSSGSCEVRRATTTAWLHRRDPARTHRSAQRCARGESR